MLAQDTVICSVFHIKLDMRLNKFDLTIVVQTLIVDLRTHRTFVLIDHELLRTLDRDILVILTEIHLDESLV